MKSTMATAITLLVFLIVAVIGVEEAKGQEKDSGDFAYAGASQIEVAFVLDTTGSMGGLIEGAKQKIWSIANQIVSAKPTPKLKIALIGYRDRGDAYITKVFDLSEDIDTVYSHLQKFQAGGGGDGPESVNQALDESVKKISWSSNKEVLKIVFLVGDAPPHMDYANDIKYQEIAKAAVKNDLIINTIQCGSDTNTTRIWKEIAGLAEGSFVALAQSGNMQTISTPFDAELGKLNAEIGSTVVAYGAKAKRRSIVSKHAAAESMAAPAMADRLAYSGKTGKVVGGGGDLIDALADGKVDLKKVKKEELPQQLREMNEEEREEYVKAKGEKRKKVRAEIDQLLKKRQAFIDSETKKRIAQGKGDSFDEKVFEIIRTQAGSKGIKYSR